MSRDMTAEEIFAKLTPDDIESIKKGQADIAAGRWYRYHDGVLTPNPEWPDDGTRPDDWPEPHKL